MADYDIVTVGGGVGGASIARAMAENGKKVLVLERETSFRDRVRGEWMAPWGTHDAQKLGLYDTLIEAGAGPAPKIAAQAGPMALPVRDLRTESALGMPALTMYHPDMQEALIAAAAQAGAEVRRGAKVTGVTPGSPAAVEFEVDGGTRKVTARLVVGADGRNSMVRKWAGFESREHRGGNMLAGVLLEDVKTPPDTSTIVFNPFVGKVAFIFPQGNGKARAYLGVREGEDRLQGDSDLPKFIDNCVAAGASAELYANSKQAGPVATFPGYDSWVEHPYKDGVALVGDAAQTSDQTWGQGLSITMRDCRLLRDELVATDDWDTAGHRYGVAANESFLHIQRVEDWMTMLMMDQSPEASTFRTQALPRIAMDPTVLPDTHFSGPELAPADEAARVKLFGE